MLFNGDLQAGAPRRAGGAGHCVETVQRDRSGDNAAPPDDPAVAGCAAAARAPDSEARFFLALGIDRPLVAAAREAASRNGTTIECELLAAGVVHPHRYYETLARMLRLPYLETIAPEAIIQTRDIDSVLRRPEHLAVRIGGTLLDAIAPTAAGFADLMQRLNARPELRARLAVAAPATIRRAVWASRADERASEAVLRLSAHHRERSASIIVTGLQGFAAGLVFSSLVAGLLVVPGPFINAAHVILATFFLVCVVLRIVALAAYRRPSRVNVGEAPAGPLPVYTVVVALHDEARMAGQLVRALMRLKWPRSLLDIKLICEADDDATIGALEALDLPREFEIIRVPAIGPRTKPKALAYALAGARGDYLVIYDAEDRPHPEQLREAYSIFANSGDDLAVIQAPLVISNAGASPVSAVFAMEYACLFRGLLPFLARHRLPIPLGGTSNHFRGLM